VVLIDFEVDEGTLERKRRVKFKLAKCFLPAAFLVILAPITPTAAETGAKPNIVFILTDNLGYGEIGSYGGGLTRGAATPRIDSIAKAGMRLLNMNMETQCTPSRSSLMTGRWAIRSGTHSVPFGGVADAGGPGPGGIGVIAGDGGDEFVCGKVASFARRQKSRSWA